MDMSSFLEELKRKSGFYGEKAWQITEEWYTRNGKARRLSLHDLHELSTSIAESLKAAILADEPKELECSTCGRKESAPYDEGDSCYCGGKFLADEPKEERGRRLRFAQDG